MEVTSGLFIIEFQDWVTFKDCRIWTAKRLYSYLHFVSFLSQNVNFYLIIFKTITARKKLIAWSVSCGWFLEDLTRSWNFPFIVNIVMSSWISNEGKVNGIFNVGKWTPWIKFPDIMRISEFQPEIHTVKAMLCITNTGLKKRYILDKTVKGIIRNTVS